MQEAQAQASTQSETFHYTAVRTELQPEATSQTSCSEKFNLQDTHPTYTICTE